MEYVSFDRVPVRRYACSIPDRNSSIAVVGDVQRTSYGECFFCNREVNDVEQGVLLSDIGRRSDLAGVVLLGDMVFDGSDPTHWAYFDSLMARSGLATLPLFPLLGNHEYWEHGDRNLRYVAERFPALDERRYYGVTWGDVRLLMLDVNKRNLGRERWESEMSFLDDEIRSAAADCSRGLIVFAHQSPYTESALAPDDLDVQRDVVSRFCKSDRPLAFVSAHAHGYERWMNRAPDECERRHVPFIVSAGGGGPRPSVRRAGAPTDDSTVKGWPRPFNYLVLSQSATALTIEAHTLEKGGTIVEIPPHETLHVPLPAARGVGSRCMPEAPPGCVSSSGGG